jgi:hypothetical protein
MLPVSSVPAPAEAVSANSDSASAGKTSHDFETRSEVFALATSRTAVSHIAAVPLFSVTGRRRPSKSHPKG